MPSFVFAEEGISHNGVILEAKEKKLFNSNEWKALLHYDSGKSMVDKNSEFFLDKKGYKNLEKEMNATIKFLYDKSLKGDSRAFCKFPARASFLQKNLNINLDFDFSSCLGYGEAIKKIPMENVYIVFASENNSVPTSVMGHVLLKFSGNYLGKKREHAFSYFATDVDTNSPKFYFDVVFSSIDGLYVLSPYRAKKEAYLDEKRSVWEVELELDEEQKSYLHKHIWELKRQNVRYSFINHNCGTASMNLLKIVYPEVGFEKKYKPFATPIDYILELNKEQKTNTINLIPSSEYMEKQKKSKQPKNILDSLPSSKLYLGYKNLDKDAIEMSFMPVYQDFYDVHKAQYDDYESKTLSINAIYDDKFYIDRIDILKMRSIIGASSIKDVSKYLKIAMENSIEKQNTSLKPVFEVGAGYSFPFFEYRVKPYVLPKVGYRYDDVHNAYIVSELGLILNSSENSKIVVSYEKYFNSEKNNRGFDEKFGANFAYLITKTNTLNISYNRYNSTVSKNNEEIRFGVGFSF